MPVNDELVDDNTNPLDTGTDELPIMGMDQASIVRAVRKLMSNREGLLKA